MGQGSKAWPFSVGNVVAAMPVVAFHSLIVYRMSYVSFGWPAVLFSPGLAWCIPLIGLLLFTHYRHRTLLPADKKAQ